MDTPQIEIGMIVEWQETVTLDGRTAKPGRQGTVVAIDGDMITVRKTSGNHIQVDMSRTRVRIKQAQPS